MSRPASFTVAAIGRTGQGKSSFLNAYLQREAFGVYDGDESGTSIPVLEEAVVEGETRRGIDTVGLEDSRGDDQGHVNQMVDFFRQLEGGVNVFAIVFNGQDPRFCQTRQKLIKIIHQGFGNIPKFWDHVCLVFTRCKGEMPGGSKFRESVLRVIHECQGEHPTQIALPAFFVDSPKWNNPKHPNTRLQIKKLHEFVRSLDPLPTEAVVTPNVNYLKIEPEFDEIVDTEIIKLSHKPEDEKYEDREQVKHFQRRTREKRTGFDRVTVTYSDWTVTRTWEERKRSFVHKEFQRRVPVGKPRIVDLPHGREDTEYADKELTQDYKDQVRKRRTDFDGVTVPFSGWKVIRTYHERKRSSIRKEFRYIKSKPVHVGDKIPPEAEVGAGFGVGAGGLAIGAAAGGVAGAVSSGAAVGGTAGVIGGPVGAAIGGAAGTVIGLVCYGIGRLIAGKIQVGWEQTWQEWNHLTDFDESTPSKVEFVREYSKFEKC